MLGEEGSKQQAVRIGAVAASNPGSAGKAVVAEMVALCRASLMGQSQSCSCNHSIAIP